MASISVSSLKPLLLLLLAHQTSAAQYSISWADQTQLCDQYQTRNTSNGLYTVATNAWGSDGSGAQCLTVGNNSDPKSNATAFATTWGWSNSPNNVHAYPNVMYDPGALPLALRNLSSLSIDVTWAYNEDASSGGSDFGSLGTLHTVADVAVDIFLDPDPLKAVSTTKPAYEIMVWIGTFGTVYPIGHSNGTVTQMGAGGAQFQLYVGENGSGQKVFSWVSTKNLTSFAGDISPLVRRVAFHGGPQTSDYLGIYQFGTEAFHTDGAANVTFTAKTLTMNLVKGIAPIDNAAPTLVARNTGLLIVALSYVLWTLA